MEIAKNFLNKMLNFDTMITPTIIKIVYSVFTSLSVLYGLIMIIGGINSRYGGGFNIFIGLIVIIISPFVTRIWCEAMIVIFKINENLSKLARQRQEY